MAVLTVFDDPAAPGTALAALRRAGRVAHERVDAAFAGFDLADPASYGAFLDVHAAIVLPLEALLRRFPLPPWTSRADRLRADLAALGRAIPPPVTIASAGTGTARDGWCHGALYVLEGSRLGGRVLARRVQEGLPHAYLSAGHGPGDWQAFLDVLGARLDESDRPFRDGAVRGAIETFALFERAAS